MSPNDVLAANLWTWPDPLIKRDRSGLVMFVNAAFLGLYGGRVQDWQGNVVTGWPAPSTQAAQRFETRAGQGADEIIYDWVEMPLSDGNVLAIARDVTIFVTATPPASVQPVTAPAHNPPAQPSHTQNAQTAHTHAAEPVHNSAVHEPVQSAMTPPSQAIAEPQVAPPAPTPEPAPITTPDSQPSLNSTSAPQNNNDGHSGMLSGVAGAGAALATGASLAGASQAAESPATPPEAPQPQEERMMERRTLPVEDSTSVLGVNWRDQVIAKAVGGEAEGENADEATASGDQDEVDGAQGGDGKQLAAGLKILLAEDNAINALLTRTLLEAEGAHVDTVEDGALALQAVKENEYDLIFMDMRMPNMDGLESTRKIRAYGADLPIIALTANAFDDDRNACFDSGMNDFMTKPVSAEELSAMVQEWTKKKSEKAA